MYDNVEEEEEEEEEEDDDDDDGHTFWGKMKILPAKTWMAASMKREWVEL